MILGLKNLISWLLGLLLFFTTLSADEKSVSLKGKIVEGRYYFSNNSFSCRAQNFGYPEPKVVDYVIDQIVSGVVFFGESENLIGVKVITLPEPVETQFHYATCKKMIDLFGLIRFNQNEDTAGIEILEEETPENNALFIAISIATQNHLKPSKADCLRSVRGFLAFQQGNTVILITSQEAISPDDKRAPKRLIETLKRDLLDFKNSMEFPLARDKPSS